MSNFTPVKPGDLITAAYFNQVLGSFDSRISALEGATSSSGAVVITGISPTGPVQVGQQLTVSGKNFGFSVGAQQVFIDTVQVNAFLAGCSDQQLIFNIPTSITNVPAAGRSATLSVGNGISTVTQTIFLLPAFTLGGSADVNYIGPITGAITAGQPATFQFTILSRANLDATYTIQAAISGPANAGVWTNNIQILDGSKNVNTSMTIQLFSGQQQTFYVSINPVPAGSTGPFNLTVSALVGNTVFGGSGLIPMTVGQTGPQPDTTITLNLQLPDVAILPATGGSVTTTQIQLKAGAQAMIPFQVTFTVVGSYSVTAVSSDASWSAAVYPPATPTLPIVIQASDLNNSAKTATRNIGFLVAPGASASASASVQFQVQNAGVVNLCSYPMSLQLGK
jgi:hypothetical protein